MTIAIKVGDKLRTTLNPFRPGTGVGANGYLDPAEAGRDGQTITISYDGTLYSGVASEVVYEDFRYWEFKIPDLPEVFAQELVDIWIGEANINEQFENPEDDAVNPNRSFLSPENDRRNWEEITPNRAGSWTQIAGRVSEEIRAGDRIAVGAEVMRVIQRSGNRVIVARAAHGTEAKEHKEGDTVQRCYYVNRRNAMSVLLELVETYADTGGAVFNQADLLFLQNVYISPFTVSAVITKPTSIEALVEEIQQSTSLQIYYDSTTRQMRASAIIGANIDGTQTITFGDGDVIEGSVKITDEPRKAATRVLVYHGLNDATDIGKDKKNWKNLTGQVNTVLETPLTRGEAKQITIYSRWINGENQARLLAERLLVDGESSAGKIEFEVPIDVAVNRILLGNIYQYFGRNYQDEFGNNKAYPFRVVSIQALDATKAKITGARSGFVVTGENVFRLDTSLLDSTDIVL